MKLARLVAAIGIAGMLGGMGQAQANLAEGFDGAIPPPGWTIINNSSPIGITDWFQGNTGVFNAQAGAADSYIAANFLAAADGGNIRDWLLTPTISMNNGGEFSFWTRTETGSAFGDQLAVFICLITQTQNCTTTAGFTIPLISLFTVSDSWTEESAIFSGLTGTAGRIGFLYRVNDTSVNGNYIGIDTVQVADVPVPEPSTLAVFALGLAMLGWHLRRGVTK